MSNKQTFLQWYMHEIFLVMSQHANGKKECRTVGLTSLMVYKNVNSSSNSFNF